MGRRIRGHIVLFLIILMSILLQSCPNSLAEIIEEDITVYRALDILSTVPPYGEKDAFLDTTIQIRFDKELDSSTVTESNISVSGESGIVSGTIEYNSHTKTLIFTPDSNLEQQKNYSVTIKKGFESSDGYPLVNEYSWTFSTGISTSKPDGTISAVSETNEDTVTLNFTRDNLYVTKMTVYVESPSITKETIGILGRDFQSQVVYTHSITAGNDENYTFSVIFHNDNFINSDEKTTDVYIDKNPPDTPSVTGQTITNDTTPTWQWAAVPDAVKYWRSYDDTNWTDLGNASSFTPSSALPDNTYTLYVRSEDSAGNISASGSKTTTIDSTVTTPTVYITGYPASVADNTPTWQWDSVSGAVKYRYKLDSSTLTTGATETASLSYTPGSVLSEGSHTLYVQAQNAALVWSETGSYTVTVDTTPPAVTYLRINNGSAYATSTSVTLNSSVSGVYQMRFSNDNSTWSSWQTYSTSKSWTITSGDGTKTVYAQYRDSLYNTTSSVSDTINLDTDTPSPSILINSGADYSTADNRTVTAGVTISGDYGYLEFYDSTNGYSGFISYSGTSVSRSVTFTSDGTKTIYVRAKDAAGHISGWVNDSIIIDTIHPNAPTVSCSSTSPDTTPTWTWSSNGGGNGTFYREIGDSTPDSSTTSTSYTPTLPFADGSYIMYVTERDDAGNVSSAASSSYSLNVTGISPDNGASVTAVLGRVTLDWPNPILGYSDKLYVGLFNILLRRIVYTEVYSGTAGVFTGPINSGTNLYYWYYARTSKIGTVNSPVFQFTGTN